jgi:hypothetical protein
MNNLDFLIAATESYHNISQLIKVSYIKKLKSGKYQVTSKKGKNLGTYPTKEEAEERLKEVEMFKHMKKMAESHDLDLTKIEDFSYSAIMRKINSQLGQEAAKEFAKIYKNKFDQYLISGDQNPEKKSLKETLNIFKEKYDTTLNKKVVKEAAAKEIGSAPEVAKYLSNIIRFTLNKIKPEKRPDSIRKLKQKIMRLDVMEMSNKKMPASSAMGQSITFVKHSLFGQNPKYIRDVLYYIARIL